jgi:hypothetical protein
MIPISIFVAFIVLAAAGLFYAVRGETAAIHQPQELLTRCRHVDLEAFRNLADPRQEQFLAMNLTSAKLHRLQRQRARVLLVYVESVAHNAALLINLGANARLSQDAEQRDAGARLVNAALQMRIHALKAIVKLRIALLLPTGEIGLLNIPDIYSSLTETASLLFRIQAPATVSRVLAAL